MIAFQLSSVVKIYLGELSKVFGKTRNTRNIGDHSISALIFNHEKASFFKGSSYLNKKTEFEI